MLARKPAELAGPALEIGRDTPELAPQLLGPDEVASSSRRSGAASAAAGSRPATPSVPPPPRGPSHDGRTPWACVFREHEVAWPWVGSGRARGVIAAGVRRPADAVLVTAGPWTPEVVDTTGGWRPIGRSGAWWSRSSSPTRRAMSSSEAGVEAVAASPAQSDRPGGTVFSAVTADGVTSVGSTFLDDEPDPDAWAGAIRRGGVPFLPALADAEIRGLRACARPQSLDGRPLIGAGIDGLWVAAGHGPWGISTGPATARIVADAILTGAAVPAALSVRRV